MMSVLIMIKGTVVKGSTQSREQESELRDLPLITVRTLAISCMTLYLTLESASWPKPR